MPRILDLLPLLAFALGVAIGGPIVTALPARLPSTDRIFSAHARSSR